MTPCGPSRTARPALGGRGPRGESEGDQGDAAKVQASAAPVLAQMNSLVASKQLAPCVEVAKAKPGADKQPLTGEVGGKALTVTAAGETITLEIKGGAKLEQKAPAGGDAYLDSAYTSADGKSLAVVVNTTAEAMSAYAVVWFAIE